MPAPHAIIQGDVEIQSAVLSPRPALQISGHYPKIHGRPELYAGQRSSAVRRENRLAHSEAEHTRRRKGGYAFIDRRAPEGRHRKNSQKFPERNGKLAFNWRGYVCTGDSYRG